MPKFINPDNVPPPFANYSHAVEIPAKSRILFCSGQLSVSLNEPIPEGAEGQTVLIFENIKAVLKDANMTIANIIRINTYVTSREHLTPFMKVRDSLFKAPAPASTLIIVSGFSREEFLVEIEVVAAATD